MRVLLSWSGMNSDPQTLKGQELILGPQMQFLSLPNIVGTFDLHIVFAVVNTSVDAEALKAAVNRKGLPVKQIVRIVKLSDPTDYAQIRSVLIDHINRIKYEFHLSRVEFSVLLTSGTPQMRTSWLVLVATKALEARLIQTVPLALAKELGIAPWREVDVCAALALDELVPKCMCSPHIGGKERPTLRKQVRELELKIIRQTLTECKGNRSKAARLLGISRNTLRSRLEEAVPATGRF